MVVSAPPVAVAADERKSRARAYDILIRSSELKKMNMINSEEHGFVCLSVVRKTAANKLPRGPRASLAHDAQQHDAPDAPL